MANYAYYEIYAKGHPIALQFLENSLSCADMPVVELYFDADGCPVLYHRCYCNWSLDYSCRPIPVAKCIPWDMESFSPEDAESEDLLKKLRRMPMVQKSKVLQLKIQLHEWSDESDFEYFTVYDHGKKLPIHEDEWQEITKNERNRIFWCKNRNASIQWGSYTGLISMNLENPPLWFRDDFPDYQEFCKVFGINPKVLKESMWTQIDEKYLRYYKILNLFTCSDWGIATHPAHDCESLQLVLIILKYTKFTLLILQKTLELAKPLCYN